MKLGAVSAFVEERPAHSRHHIMGLIESLSAVEGLETLVIANGAEPSKGLRDYISGRSSVTLIEVKPNVGLPLAWNMGIDLLDADAVFFLNDDLQVDEYCLKRVAGVFEALPDTAVSGVEGIISRGAGPDGFPENTVKYRKKRGLFKTEKVVEVSAAGGFLFAVSREFLKATGFRVDPRFTPAFCEELDLALSARAGGYKIRIVTGLDRHYDHSHGISSGPKEIRYLGRSIMSDELAERNRRLFLDKWGGRVPLLFGP